MPLSVSFVNRVVSLFLAEVMSSSLYLITFVQSFPRLGGKSDKRLEHKDVPTQEQE